MKLLILFISLLILNLSISQNAHATVTINSVTGASVSPDLTKTTLKIFGGVSGQTENTNTTPFNSCSLAWDGVTQADNICNENQIGDSTELTITFSSTTSGTVELRNPSGGTAVPGFVGPAYTAGTTASVTFDWNIICSADADVATCEQVRQTPGNTFSLTLNFGINSDGNTTIDDNKEITFVVAAIPSGLASTSEGVSDFALYPGDAKAYLEDFTAGYSLPEASAAKLLFFLRPSGAIGSSCGGTEDTISYNDDVAEVALLTDEGSTTKSFETEFFEGLENGVEYDVRPAIEDEAGNIGLFYDYSGGCTKYRNSVLPQPVSGLLSDNSGCFIATAAYGSSFEEHVHTLRLFRDMFLLKSEIGKHFVNFYYTYSPAIADVIRNSETLKFLTRIGLAPLWAMSYSLVHYGVFMTLLLTCVLVGVLYSLKFLLNQKKNLLTKVVLAFLVIGIHASAQEQSSTTFPDEELNSAENEIYNEANQTQPQAPTTPPAPEIAAPAETAPLEPPYTGVESDEFQNLEQSIDKSTPEAPTTAEEEYPIDEAVSASPKKWEPYQRVPEPQRIKQLHDNEGLTQITKKGEFLYDVNQSPQNSAASFRVGTFEGPNLEGSNGVTFQDVYGEDTKFLLLADYEWQFYKKFGKLGIRVGSGIMYAEGSGFFTDTTFFDDGSGQQVATEAREDYNLFVFPNNVGLIYRAQFYDKQWIVPFAEIGLDYFAIVEYRDDGDETNFGGSPHFHFAAGGSFSLNTLSRELAINVDREYGINNMWLTAEYRRLEQITGDFDFSDDIYSAGFMFEF